MAASQFYREHALLMRPGTSADHAQRMTEAYEAVRDKWISERRFADLVKAIIANWTSGNCVAYMVPLSQALIAAGEIDLHRYLWSRTIKRQVTTLFHVLGKVDGKNSKYLRLLNLDTAGFVETDPASHIGVKRAAFLLQRLSADILLWKAELRCANLPTDTPEQIERSLQVLKMPRIAVSRLPPNTSFKPSALRGSA